MNWKTTASAASLAVFIASASSATAAEGPKVAASILPLHSFAQQLLGQAGELELLLPPAVSPHGFTLKPSQRRAIEEAQILYWVGPSLERPIEKILESSPVQQQSVPLEDRDAGLAIHSFREGHGDHHEGHGHEDEHEDDHGHEEGAIDPHIWLSLDNARKIMQLIGEDFFEIDEERRSLYSANLSNALQRLDGLRADAQARMTALTPKPYMVFHDAYQYFERDYGLEPAGVISVAPERAPSAGHLTELRERIEHEDIACLFVEPQFPLALAETVVEGTGVPLVEIDPLGVNLEPGPEAYRDLYLGLVSSFEVCFGD